MGGSTKKNTLTLYVKDAEYIKNLAKELGQLHYEKYHECPTQSEIVSKALALAKDVYTGDIKRMSPVLSISDIFGRV